MESLDQADQNNKNKNKKDDHDHDDDDDQTEDEDEETVPQAATAPKATTATTSTPTTLHDVLQAMDCLTRAPPPGSLCTAGVSKELPALPGLVVDGLGEVALPVNANVATQLIPLAAATRPTANPTTTTVQPHHRPVLHRRGRETVLMLHHHHHSPYPSHPHTTNTTNTSTTNPNAWDIRSSQLALTNPAWSLALEGVVTKVCHELGVNPVLVHAELHKLVLHRCASNEEDDTHEESYLDVDSSTTPTTSKGRFATLLVQLPSRFTGGSWTISHPDQDVAEDEADDSRPRQQSHTYQYHMEEESTAPFVCHYLAHYIDCQRHGSVVTSGTRVSLYYGLYYTKRKNDFRTQPPLGVDLLSSSSPLVSALRQLPTNNDTCSLWAVPLQHTYTGAALARLGVGALHGVDRALARTVRHVGGWELVLVTAVQRRTTPPPPSQATKGSARTTTTTSTTTTTTTTSSTLVSFSEVFAQEGGDDARAQVPWLAPQLDLHSIQDGGHVVATPATCAAMWTIQTESDQDTNPQNKNKKKPAPPSSTKPPPTAEPPGSRPSNSTTTSNTTGDASQPLVAAGRTISAKLIIAPNATSPTLIAPPSGTTGTTTTTTTTLTLTQMPTTTTTTKKPKKKKPPATKPTPPKPTEALYTTRLLIAFCSDRVFERLCQFDFSRAVQAVHTKPVLLDRAIQYLQDSNQVISWDTFKSLHSLLEGGGQHQQRSYWTLLPILVQALPHAALPSHAVSSLFCSLIKEYGWYDPKLACIRTFWQQVTRAGKKATCNLLVALVERWYALSKELGSPAAPMIATLLHETIQYFNEASNDETALAACYSKFFHYNSTYAGKLYKRLQTLMRMQTWKDTIQTVVLACLARIRKRNWTSPVNLSITQLVETYADQIPAIQSLTASSSSSTESARQLWDSLLTDLVDLLVVQDSSNPSKKAVYTKIHVTSGGIWKASKIGVVVQELLVHGTPAMLERIETWASTAPRSILSDADTVLQSLVLTSTVQASHPEATERVIHYIHGRIDQLHVQELLQEEQVLLDQTRGGPPAFTWRMPTAHTFIPSLDAFLHGPKQGPVEIFVGGGAQYARNLARRFGHTRLPNKSNKSGSINDQHLNLIAKKNRELLLQGLSVDMHETGNMGTYASVMVTKTRDLHNALVQDYMARMHELSQVRAKLQALGHDPPTEDDEDDENDDDKNNEENDDTSEPERAAKRAKTTASAGAAEPPPLAVMEESTTVSKDAK